MSLDTHPFVADWLAVRNGRLLVRTGKVDIGQRISTALAGVVHEESTLPMDLIDLHPVATGDSPDEGMTSGSNSIEQSGRAVRLATATLREAVLDLAADNLDAPRADWRLEAGLLKGPGSNRPLAFLDLAGELDLRIPVALDAPLWQRQTVPALPMRGMSDLVNGQYRFLHDTRLPGMLHARVVRPPHAKARLTALRAETADNLRNRGFQIVQDGSFLAIAGPREWPLIKAAARLAAACQWAVPPLDDTDIFAQLTPEKVPGITVEDGVPRPDAPLPAPLESPRYRARYERPFTMHGSLGPSAACARWDGQRLDIDTHSQGIYPLRESIAESLGLNEEDVRIAHAPGAGCYGHNGADDAAFEAALVAWAIPNTPILLKWSREDEHCREPYGPASAIELAVQIADDGQLQAFSAAAIGGTFRGRPRTGAGHVGPQRLVANQFREDPLAPYIATPNLNKHGGLHRNLDPIYAIPETRLTKHLVPSMPLRTSALRCLGAGLNSFAIESFVDEIARSEGQDPLAFRLAHLRDPRAIAVLNRLAAETAQPPANGIGRGIAYAQYKNAMTRVAIAVDLEVSDRGEIRLVQVTLVADAGRIVDRNGLAAQLEGGVIQGASWALHEAVTWDRDGVTARDWDSYPVIRFDNIPKIALVLEDNPGEPAVGAGEASPGPTLAAIANAVFDSTRLRLRRLPFTPDAMTEAALSS